MIGIPLDAWYVWIGVAIVSSTVFGVVTLLPSAPPPNADTAAQTVDGVAASDYAAVGKHPLSNTEMVRIGSDSISVRGGGGTDHAAFGYGPVVPVTQDSILRVILHGEPPQRAFNTPREFERAIQQTRTDEPQWQAADSLTVRRVHWEDIDVVLVG